MRKLLLFSAVLSLFLLVTASITWAQTISTQKGLTTAVFNTPYGNLKVYLPEIIRTGETISGTIVAEPIGKNLKQAEKNLTELGKYNFKIDGFSIDDRQSWSWQVQKEKHEAALLELFNEKGNKSGEIPIQLSKVDDTQSIILRCIIPSHAVIESPIRISGPFDGDASNTKCSLDGKELQVLAESNGQCIVSYPTEAAGIKTLNVQEKEKQLCSQQISSVQLNVSAGKLNLLKGEKTYIDVGITGLQHLPDTAFLILNNLTTGIVTMQPSNLVIIPLPKDAVRSGTFHKRFEILSLKTGTFSVNVNLDLPDGFQDQLHFNKVEQLEDSLRKIKDELEQKKRERDITIDDEIKKAEKEKRDCDKELEEAKKKAAADAEALEKAKQKKENIEKNTGPGKTFPDKDAAKKNFGDYEKEYEDAKKASDAANINLAGLKKKCPELTKTLEKLRKRKTEALPAEIEKGEKNVKELTEELEREKTKAEDEKKKLEDEQKRKDEEQRQKTQAEKDTQDAKYKTKAENIYLLQNIYSLGLISSKIWETPGLMDWLPDVLEKPIGDAAEDLVKTPIPLDAITAIAGLYGVVGAKLDPCTAEGSITTIKRLKGMKNSKTGINYTDDEALDKTDRMCELLKKLKAIAAAAKK